ncbi:MAG: mevalonate kinase [Anaerolineales bacterium]|nr:mevalonate kinase [Anaerolineales bacterium]MCB9127146.1 mevalonate kinase [Ardenticatenales bacterium]MCB9171906.1 mevalonate kinase [Ardenticatenales bacterium]
MSNSQHDPPDQKRRAWGSAPAKLILFGEHAVVYDQPAIAVPMPSLKARAVAVTGRRGGGVILHAETIGRHYLMDAVGESEPLAFTCRNVLRWLGIERQPDVDLHLMSDIPIASGLGSGAATAAAIARALARWLGYEFSPAQLSALVYRTEQLHHGTPSGIDNTVVAFEQPIWFRRHAPLETLPIGARLCLVVADSGESSPTRITVGEVRRQWQREPAQYEALFAAVGDVVQRARAALAAGDGATLGALMNENQQLLEAMGVSAPTNERLAEVARRAGALGAKLSGGGRGGNNVALVARGDAERVAEALRQAGARQLFVTEVG